MLRTVLLISALHGLVSCHPHLQRPDPVRTADILELTEQGVGPDEIIRRIDASFTVYHMSARDVVDLDRAGVDARVIEHMMQTAERHAERRARRYYRRPALYHDPWYPHWHRYDYPMFYPGIGIGFGFGRW